MRALRQRHIDIHSDVRACSSALSTRDCVCVHFPFLGGDAAVSFHSSNDIVNSFFFFNWLVSVRACVGPQYLWYLLGYIYTMEALVQVHEWALPVPISEQVVGEELRDFHMRLHLALLHVLRDWEGYRSHRRQLLDGI